jgi:hypothetical protein
MAIMCAVWNDLKNNYKNNRIEFEQFWTIKYRAQIFTVTAVSDSTLQ